MHLPEGKETWGIHSSARPLRFQLLRGEEEWHCGLCAHKMKRGEVFYFPFLTHCRVRDRKGYLKLAKDSLLNECTQRSQELLGGISIAKVTAEWPLFFKLELQIMVCNVTVYADKL